MYHHLLDAIEGIILLGTPHRGSSIHRLGILIASTAEICGYGDSTFIDQVDKSCMETFDFINDFMKTVSDQGLLKSHSLICCFETYESNIGQRLHKGLCYNTMVGFNSGQT